MAEPKDYVVTYKQTIIVTAVAQASSKAAAIRKVRDLETDVSLVSYDTVPGTRRLYEAMLDDPKPGDSGAGS